jgi:hypothetical protein
VKSAGFVFLVPVIFIALAISIHQYIFSIINKVDISNFVPSINWSNIGQSGPVIILAIIGSILTIIGYWKGYGFELPWSRKETKAKAVPPTEHHRRAMIDKVRNDWISGFLFNSLLNIEAMIDLDIDESKDRIDLRGDLVVKQPNCAPRDLPSSARIIDIFDELGRSFLILGDPGSGKTTLMLQLANKLLERADEDASLQIPVVFHLSTWGIRKLFFNDWLVEELLLRYGVPKGLGESWVEVDFILPLLDGLDEVALEHRESCVAAINNSEKSMVFYHSWSVAAQKNMTR